MLTSPWNSESWVSSASSLRNLSGPAVPTIGERKPVFQGNAGRCAHSKTLSVFQKPTNPGRTWNSDAYRDGDIFTRQGVQPVGHRVNIKAEQIGRAHV